MQVCCENTSKSTKSWQAVWGKFGVIWPLRAVAVVVLQPGAQGTEWRGMPRVHGFRQTWRVGLGRSIWRTVAVVVLLTAIFEFGLLWAVPWMFPEGMLWWQEALIDSVAFGVGLAFFVTLVLLLPLRHQLKDYSKRITEGMMQISAVEGDDFHLALVQYLAGQFKASLVLVGELTSEQTIRSLAGWTPDGLMEPVEYDIAGSPCEETLEGDGFFCVRGVTDRFSSDSLLTEVGAVSYVGVPMRSASGEVLGLVAVIGAEPLTDPESAILLVRLLASRAGTELMRSRAAHDRAEASRREKALEDLLDSIAILTTADASGTITHVNDRFCTLSGYSREELLGENHRIINSGLHPVSMWADLYRKASRGEVWQGEVRNSHKDGSYYWLQSAVTGILDDAQKLQEIVSIRFDVTDIKNAELRNRSLVAAVEASHDGMCIVDRAGVITLCNAAFRGQTSAASGDCCGYRLVDVLDRAEDKDAVSEVLATRQELTRRVRLCRASASGENDPVTQTREAEGEWMWAEIRLTPIGEDEGGEGLCVCVQRDVSAQVYEEERLRFKAEGRGAQLDISKILGDSFQLIEDRLSRVLRRTFAIDGLEVQARGSVYLADGDILRKATSVGSYGTEALEQAQCVARGSCLCGRALVCADEHEFEVLVCDDCACELWRDLQHQEKTTHGHYIVPLHSGNRLEGVLFLVTDRNPSRDTARLKLLGRLGEQIGTAIAGDRLREQAEHEEFERQLGEDLAALRMACQSILLMRDIPFAERAHEILDYLCTSECLGFGNRGSLFAVEDGGMRVLASVEEGSSPPEDDAGEIVLPLEYLGENMGELVLHVNTSGEYKQIRHEFLSGLAELLAAALWTDRLRERTERLHQDQTGTLLAVGREMRTPMTSIVAAADMLGEDGIGAEDREELTAMVQRNAGHLMSVVDNILELAGVSSAATARRSSKDSGVCEVGVLRGVRVLLLEDREGVAASVIRAFREHGAIVEVTRRAEIGISIALGSWRAERPHSLVVMTSRAAKTDVDVVPRLLREAGYPAPIMVLCDAPEAEATMLAAGCDRVVRDWSQGRVVVSEVVSLLAESSGRNAA